MQNITPSLWFDNNAEEAMNFYVSVFKDGKINRIDRYPEGYSEGPMAGMGGKVLNGEFEINGQKFICLDGGPIFKFNEAISFTVECADQDEVDYYWEKLSAVPESEQCGWLKDKFGLSWQIVPKQLGELMSGSDPDSSKRVMESLLKMKKIDITELQKAYENK